MISYPLTCYHWGRNRLYLFLCHFSCTSKFNGPDQNFQTKALGDALAKILHQRVSKCIEDLVLPGVIAMETISEENSIGKDVTSIIEDNLNTLANKISEIARSVLIQTIPGNGSELDLGPFKSYAVDLYKQFFLQSIKTYRTAQINSSLFLSCKELTFRQIDRYNLTPESKEYLKLLFEEMEKSYPTSVQYLSIDGWKKAFDRHVEIRIKGDANAGKWI